MIGDYKITFMFNRAPRWVQTPLERQWDLNDLVNGFWVTADIQLCAPSQGKFFIPASQILFIEKVE